MTSKYTSPSTSVDQAIERWLEELNPPQTVQEGLRRKFKRLMLTPEEIDIDRLAKLARIKS